jgi:hypothetical protein
MFAGSDMQNSLHEKLKTWIKRSNKVVFFRKDFEDAGEYRQVSRVLSELEKQDVIVRAGYGVYTKPVPANRREEVLKVIKGKLGKRVNRTVEVGGVVYRLGKRNHVKRNAHTHLDALKLLRAQTIVRTVPMEKIRRQSLENMAHWKAKGTWCSAYDEWTKLLTSGTDAEIAAVMTGQDQNSNRLRQSSPYAGLLDQKTLENILATA